VGKTTVCLAIAAGLCACGLQVQAARWSRNEESFHRSPSSEPLMGNGNPATWPSAQVQMV